MKKLLFMVCLLVPVAVFILYSAFRVQLNEAFIRKVIKDAQAKFNIPAAAVTVMNSEQILYSVYDGVRVTGTSEYVTAEDYFHIGSCGKMVLAYIAANLVEENAIGWDTKFFDLFPEMKAQSRAEYYDITLEDLICFTAGIKPYTSGEEAYPEIAESENPLLAFSEYLLQLEPSARRTESGKFEYLYSNASYSVASVMLEKASGHTYEELLDKYISKELGVDVFIGWPYQKDRNQPWGHFQVDEGVLEVIGPDVGYALNPLINAAGNLSMKSEDFAKFVQCCMQSLAGKTSPVSSEIFKHIHTELLGFETLQGKSVTYFDGSAGTFYARGYIIPESDFAFTISINAGSPDAVEYITNQLLHAKFKPWWKLW